MFPSCPDWLALQSSCGSPDGLAGERDDSVPAGPSVSATATAVASAAAAQEHVGDDRDGGDHYHGDCDP